MAKPIAYGVLLSHGHEVERASVSPTLREAAEWGATIAEANAGCQYELMRQLVVDGPWQSYRGESVVQVIRRRWTW